MKVSSRGVARGERGVGVAAERHRHLELAFGNFDVGAHGDVGLLVAARLDLFGAPDHRADKLLALRIGRVLVIQHHALGHRGELVRQRRRTEAILCLRRCNRRCGTIGLVAPNRKGLDFPRLVVRQRAISGGRRLRASGSHAHHGRWTAILI